MTAPKLAERRVMTLRILTPSDTIVEASARKITAEATSGSFCMLPRHIDVVASLPPGVLSFEDERGSEVYVGVDDAVLVKCGDDVTVSAERAVLGGDLDDLHRTVEVQFLARGEREQAARSALARLEAGVIRRFIELEPQP